MKKHALLMSFLLASGLATAKSESPPQLVLHGTVTTSSGDHPAWFTLMCTQGAGGALSVQLMLVADTAPDFPFDAFEGPRAPASFQPSATLKVGNRLFGTVAVSGWFSGNMPGAFVFGIASAPRGNAALNQAAAAMSHPGATLLWVQQGNNIQTPPLAARFVLDAAQTQTWDRVAWPCMPHADHR